MVKKVIKGIGLFVAVSIILISLVLVVLFFLEFDYHINKRGEVAEEVIDLGETNTLRGMI